MPKSRRMNPSFTLTLLFFKGRYQNTVLLSILGYAVLSVTATTVWFKHSPAMLSSAVSRRRHGGAMHLVSLVAQTSVRISQVESQVYGNSPLHTAGDKLGGERHHCQRPGGMEPPDSHHTNPTMAGGAGRPFNSHATRAQPIDRRHRWEGRGGPQPWTLVWIGCNFWTQIHPLC
jgi:hypothetical protein